MISLFSKLTLATNTRVYIKKIDVSCECNTLFDMYWVFQCCFSLTVVIFFTAVVSVRLLLASVSDIKTITMVGVKCELESNVSWSPTLGKNMQE